MKRSADAALSAAVMKDFLSRYTAGAKFEELLPAWRSRTGLATETLKDLLRGVYATQQAGVVYRELGYEPRSIRFAPANFRARLLAPQLLDIRRRIREGASAVEVAADYQIERETVDAIVKGKYSTLAMRDALAMEPVAQQ
ncbi:MAG TPA: hypothetical protein VLK85_13030 [Ramlibacter sp.]|nr:hypothetical protein [Ramlibacter sp.]